MSSNYDKMENKVADLERQLRDADQSYNGWTNRETWAFKLWMDNDEGLYNYFRELVEQTRETLAERDPDDANNAYMIGGAVRDAWEEMSDPDNETMSVETILQITRDIGSEYRINWDEIGAAYLAEADES